MDQLAHRRALGAMGATVDRAVPGRLLTDPDAVLHFADDRTADRAMRADVLAQLDGTAVIRRAGFSLPGHAGP